MAVRASIILSTKTTTKTIDRITRKNDMPRNTIKAPICLHCPDVEAVLVTGAQVLPKRGDLAKNFYWSCPDCGAYCGCIKGRKHALGRPADRQLREAHDTLLRDRINPLWMSAVDSYEVDHRDIVARKMIQNAARKRVYEWLADHLGVKECHVAMFDLETCRRAWVLLGKVDYNLIRDWSKSRAAGAALDAASEQAARL